MKYRSFLMLGALGLIASCSDDLELSGNMPDGGNTTGPVIVRSSKEALPNIVLVKFKEGYEQTLETASASSRGGMSRSGINEFDEFLSDVQVTSFERLFPVNKFEKRTRKMGMHLWYKVRFNSDKSMSEIERELSKIQALQVVQFDVPIRQIQPEKMTPVSDVSLMSSRLNGNLPTNDQRLPDQWHYFYNASENGPLFGKYNDIANVNLFEAWKKQMSAKDVIVAVVDQGVDYDHPDLVNNMWVNEPESQGSDEDKDGNGYSGDRHGYDFVVQSGVISKGGHGTHVAGTVAAESNNNLGVAGIAGGDGNGNGARIMTCCIFDNSGNGGTSSVAEAVKYAADNGAVICQNSWGYTNPNTQWDEDDKYSAERVAYQYFMEYAGKDVDGKVVGPMDGGLVVFAAGNYGHQVGDVKMWPAAYPDFLSVASLGADFTPAYYTDYGTWVDLSAPGGDQVFVSSELSDSLNFSPEYDMKGGVLSTFYNPLDKDAQKQYAYSQGTSMSCPHVSGIAALAVQHAKDKGMTGNNVLKASELKEILIESTHPVDEYFKGTKTDDGKMTGVKFTINMEDYRGKMGTGLIDASLVLSNIESRAGGIGKPAPEAVQKDNFQIKEGSAAPGSLTLQWSVGTDKENAKLTMYKLYISPKPIKVEDGRVVLDKSVLGPQLVVVGDKNPGDKLECTLGNLKAETSYFVAIVGIDKYRLQSIPTVKEFVTSKATNGPAVSDLKILETGAAKVQLQWTESSDCVNEPYVSYVITCATDKEYKNNVVSKTVLANGKIGDIQTVTLTGLSPKTSYFVKVEAWDQFYLLSKPAESAFTTSANRLPIVNPGTVEMQNLHYWETKTLSFEVTDPDNDNWEAVLEDKTGVWTMTRTDKTVSLVFAGPVTYSGSSEAVLTITDVNDGTVVVKVPFNVTANSAPKLLKKIDNVYLNKQGEAYLVDLKQHFADANGEQLQYVTKLLGTSVDLNIEGDNLSILGVGNGLTKVELIASDAEGKSVSTKFEVMVRQSAHEVDLYPNPVQNIMNIRMGEDVEGDINVKLLTQSGSLAYKTDTKISPFQPAQVDLSELKPGSYVVEISYNGQVYKNNIVKL